MACFLVPGTEAVVTTIVTKVVKSKERKAEKGNNSKMINLDGEKPISFSRKLSWLNNLLWGGSALLAFEHVWHGEVVPWFPFLTGASTPDSAAEMLHEMSTTGVSMAALVTVVWLGMVAVSNIVEKKPQNITKQMNRVK